MNAGLAEGHAEGRAKGRAEGIIGVVDIMREDGKSDSEIINKIKARFTLTQEQAEEYVLPKVMA